MTESRVLMHYIAWVLAPSLDSLTLYHDDIAISRGLFQPPTTFAAILAILCLLCIAFWQRARRPLLALGILWFFAGHILTGTIIPLMIAFEHRNYFPSTGLLLAGTAILVLEGPMLRMRIVTLGTGCLLVFYASTTALRAVEWSNPLHLAASDALKRPDSSAAQYEYARVLLSSSVDGDPEPMRRKAFDILERMAQRPDADAVHEQLLIVTHAKLARPINPRWWESMIAKLRSHPPTSVDSSALVGLLNCFREHVCPNDIEHLKQAFAAAVDHPGGYAPLLSAYASFAFRYMHDLNLAERMHRAAIAQNPSDPTTHSNLVVFLAQVGRVGDARAELEILRSMNRMGALDPKLAELESNLRDAQSRIDSREHRPKHSTD